MNLSRPQLLLVMTFVMSLVFAVWQVLLNNFVVEAAAFTGKEIGMLQSLREIPGFLAFTSILVLLVIKEQRFALAALLLMCIGVAATGWFPSALGLYCTTVLMSIGFHYYETCNQSLTLQWLPKHQTAQFLGQALSVKAAGALLGYGSIWLLMTALDWPYAWVYSTVGGLGALLVVAAWWAFPQFQQHHQQQRKLLLRRRYSLYYLLTFLSGARRQIFMVFAAFMMVEKFGYSVSEITALFLINYLFNLMFAKKIGGWIGQIGERRTLIIEYLGLILVFVSYAAVEHPTVAAGLYVVDHLFFALAIAVKTYFQKIADPDEIASTAGISFTINHIAAVIIPALLGLVWLHSPALVFYIGAGIALCSLLAAMSLPALPAPGNETRWGALFPSR
ncbi:Predicted arabinose efflux permease, MFS family [Ferrimonas sediminum]|uniref:Predicted arabinose efflux permease, MFS family n=2 Tax=Ferrimonas sediminum TaxID=718193 RepID=A0A1G8MBA1_9GAMM|nr:Predicted arabinose efflux permease, MFS family [Ferrimonas sediminum]